MAETATQVVRIRELALPIEDAIDPEPPLRQLTATRLGVATASLPELKVVKRALDARHRALRYVYTVEVGLEKKLAERLMRAGRTEPVRRIERYRHKLSGTPNGPRPVVVGAGPAGLFAALTLAEAGWAPLVIERGRKVEERARDVSKLYARGILDAESNVCYGEGGAGAFSDGKLYTRVNDSRVERVMEALVERGANPDIRIDNRPHLGTDKLIVLLKSIRNHLETLGTTFRFSTAVESFEVNGGTIEKILLRDGETIDADRVVLATGHSARDIWQRLIEAGLPLESRPFAVGFRVEHPQALINRLRYGATANRGVLPAADYRLTYNERGSTGRGVYSFCMCPGGVVVPTPTEREELCINGMSHASRSGRYANSALVVTVTPEDYAEAGFDGVMGGVKFQQQSESKAYDMGGGAFVAPAQRLTDYFANKPSSGVGQSSYRRGLWPAELEGLYPEAINGALRRAISSFDRKMKGFLTDDATIMGVETRTSSPVRVPRGDDLQALGATGLYPAGEGVGYGGGIVSSAVDGLRAAEAILEAAGAERIVLEEGSRATEPVSMDREIDERRFRRYELEQGWVVLVGRTDADNDYLSIRFAKPNDTWFHASGCPGSHALLLEQDGLEPDRDTVRAAAGIAAWYSKARNAKRAPVSVCRAGDVSKPRGSPRGQVTIRRERVIKVTPALPSN